VHKAGFVVTLKFQRFGQAIHMAGLFGPPLAGQSGRFIDRDDMLIPIENAGLDHLGIGVGDARLRLGFHVARFGKRKGRYANFRPRPHTA